MMNAAERLEKAGELIEEGFPADALRLLGAPCGGPWRLEQAHLKGEALRARGLLGPCLAEYNKVLKSPARWEPALWVESALGAAGALRSLGRSREARALLGRARKLSQRGATGRIRLEAALLDRAEGRFARSLGRLKTFLRDYERARDWSGVGFVLWAMGGARRFQGDLAGSSRDFSRSLAAFSRARDPEGRGYALLGLGGVERVRGKFAAAFDWYSQAERAFRKTQDLFAQAYSLCGLGNVLRQQKKLAKAQAHYRRSHKVYEKLGDRVDLAYVDWGLGRIALERGELAEAQRRLKAALASFSRYNEERGIVLAETSLASALHAVGETARAEALFARAYRRARKAGLHAHLEIFT